MNARTYSNGTKASSRVPTIPVFDVGAAFSGVAGYEVPRLLRRTPSADVYLAYHEPTAADREVVVVRPVPPDEQEALLQGVGAAVAAAHPLAHPGIAPLVDAGLTVDGRLFVATARPAGRSLSDMLADEGELPPRRALRLGLDLAEAMAAAHDAGVVHGRLSPESVLVVAPRAGERERAVVLGFGTAAAQDAALVLGGFSEAEATSPYVSPERAAGAGAGLRDDVFALGAVLLSMFVGGAPPLVRGPHRGPRPAEQAPGEEPGQIIQILRRARSADPGDRYATAGELAAALRAVDERLARTAAPAAAAAPVAPALVPDAAAPPAAPARAPLRTPPARWAARRAVRDVAAAASIVGVVLAGWAGHARYLESRPAGDAAPVRVARQPDTAALGRVPVFEPAAPGATLESPSAPADRAPDAAPAAPPDAPVPVTPRAVSARDRVVASAAGPERAPDVRGAPAARAGVPTASGRGASAVVSAAPTVVAAAPGGTAGGVVRAAPVPQTAPQTAPRTASASGDVIASSAPAASGGPAAAGAPATGTTTGAALVLSAASDAGIAAAGVRAALAEYATAIEARDLALLGRVHPGMTEAQRRAWATFFKSVADLRARLEVGEITDAGTVVHARVRGTYEYENLRPRRAERSPVLFTATLARDAAGWRVRTVE